MIHIIPFLFMVFLVFATLLMLVAFTRYATHLFENRTALGVVKTLNFIIFTRIDGKLSYTKVFGLSVVISAAITFFIKILSGL